MTDEKINLVLKFSYLGKFYHGNAHQESFNTVAYQLTSVLKSLNLYIQEPVFCGRTDKGVNAKNMVCNIYVKKLRNCHYGNYINYKLPYDIQISSYAIMPLEFSARYNCSQRHYKYYFCNYNEEMEAMCKRLLMITDFKGMCKDTKDTKRKLDAIYIEKVGDLYVLNIKAKGFLHNMVRKIFWVLSNAHIKCMDDILTGKCVAGTAEPNGLVFCCAKFDCEIGWINAYKRDNMQMWIVEKEVEKFIYDYPWNK